MGEQPKNLCIIGAGGHAKVAIMVAEAAGWTITHIFDDNTANHGNDILGHTVESPTPNAEWFIEQGYAVHIAIGNNAVRKAIAEKLSSVQWGTLIHPSCKIDDSCTIGAGSLICTESIIHPDSHIGEHTIINTRALIEHDCSIGAYTHIAPCSCITGGCEIGEQTLVGANTTLIPEISIGNNCTIGAGSTIIKNIPNNTKAAGCPAKMI